MFEHDGCNWCKHEQKDFDEFPCSHCRGSLGQNNPYYQKCSDLYEPLELEENDAVNHPSHYQGKHECIDEMIELFGVHAVMNFCSCNVYKYRYRAANKNGQEDLDKADWYMDKLMELSRKLRGESNDQY